MRRLTPLVVLGLTAVLVIAAVVAGRMAGDGSVASIAPSDAALALSHEVMSPYCPGLTLAACPSPSAFELRTEIRARFEAGDSREAIFADLVRRFGTEIEGSPPATGLGALVWGGPLVVATLLGLAVRFAVRAGAGTPDVAPTPDGSELSARQLARLDEELDQLE